MDSDPKILVRAVIVQDDSVLVCRCISKPIYFLPGGHREAGETVEEALYREIQEELGVEGELKGYLGAVEHHWKDGMGIHIGLNHFFEIDAPALSQTELPKCGDPDIELKWIPVEDLAEIQLEPRPLSSLITAWRGGKKKPWWAVHIDWKRGLEG